LKEPRKKSEAIFN